MEFESSILMFILAYSLCLFRQKSDYFVQTLSVTYGTVWLRVDKIRYLHQQTGGNYRKTSSISRTKSQSLNASCIIAQLSSLNPLKPGVKLRMKM